MNFFKCFSFIIYNPIMFIDVLNKTESDYQFFLLYYDIKCIDIYVLFIKTNIV